MNERLVVLTGAGISAESGISTFRDAGGLWEGHDVMAVASPEGWSRDPALVLEFYNQRRRQLLQTNPNPAHMALARLEQRFDVRIITQNVDDLHERAGSRNVLHLHGELRKVRSVGDPHLIYEWDADLSVNDRCALGYPLRPHIVWFGEEVPELANAARLMASADRVLVIGTSLQVYPAAGLLWDVRSGVPVDYIDPRPATEVPGSLRDLTIHACPATEGVVALANAWLA